MNRRRWQDLSRPQQVMIIAGGVLDTGMRVAGLIDVVRRPAAQIRGPKPLWIVALAAVNSLGIVPATYFVVGRRRSHDS